MKPRKIRTTKITPAKARAARANRDEVLYNKRGRHTGLSRSRQKIRQKRLRHRQPAIPAIAGSKNQKALTRKATGRNQRKRERKKLVQVGNCIYKLD